MLLLDEPTQGVDVGARNDIYRQIRTTIEAGAAAILVASDFEELAEHSDRVLIMSRGRITREIPTDRLSAHVLTQAMFDEEEAESHVS
ncbi:hypothetical protein E3O45_02040 [Cryobacterium sp. TMS1-20-1]|uniref:hypothetical protein n=1 Tax=Cryobacterium sp. TMS1-20-1 TaxID=1259223 RepID=UPI0010697D9C|nr:hypothetical protein [Cryobacterium sp. TMS1-20-1]TFC80535.1 hypothetical protein E3O45_02040 [Cryobacterium sp. TMS1-20-1]